MLRVLRKRGWHGRWQSWCSQGARHWWQRHRWRHGHRGDLRGWIKMYNNRSSLSSLGQKVAGPSKLQWDPSLRQLWPLQWDSLSWANKTCFVPHAEKIKIKTLIYRFCFEKPHWFYINFRHQSYGWQLPGLDVQNTVKKWQLPWCHFVHSVLLIIACGNSFERQNTISRAL